MVNIYRLLHTLGKHLGDSITARQLAKEAHVPYTTTLRIIKNNEYLIKTEKKGTNNLVHINMEEEITKQHLIIAEREERERRANEQPLIRQLSKEIPKGEHCVILFGSRAEQREKKESDIDLLIINKEGTQDISFSTIEILHRLEVNPLYFTKEEYEQMLNEKEHNLANEITKKHLILYGEEHYWNIVWKQWHSIKNSTKKNSTDS